MSVFDRVRQERQWKEPRHLAIVYEGFSPEGTDGVLTGFAVALGRKIDVRLDAGGESNVSRRPPLGAFYDGRFDNRMKCPPGAVIHLERAIELPSGDFQARWASLITKTPEKDICLLSVPVKLAWLRKPEKINGETVYVYAKDSKGNNMAVATVLETDSAQLVTRVDGLDDAIKAAWDAGKDDKGKVLTCGPGRSGLLIRVMRGSAGTDNHEFDQIDITEQSAPKIEDLPRVRETAEQIIARIKAGSIGAILTDFLSSGGQAEITPISQIFCGSKSLMGDGKSRKIADEARYELGKRKDGTPFSGFVFSNICFGNHRHEEGEGTDDDGGIFVKFLKCADYGTVAHLLELATPAVPQQIARENYQRTQVRRLEEAGEPGSDALSDKD